MREKERRGESGEGERGGGKTERHREREKGRERESETQREKTVGERKREEREGRERREKGEHHLEDAFYLRPQASRLCSNLFPASPPPPNNCQIFLFMLQGQLSVTEGHVPVQLSLQGGCHHSLKVH